MPVTSEKSITNALVKMLPKLWARSKKFYNDKQFKVESELGVVFKDYLEYSYEKYSTVKTLLYKNEGKFLYNFYEPQFLESENGDLNDIKEILESIEESFSVWGYSENDNNLKINIV
mgnify:CR=1 FL=1